MKQVLLIIDFDLTITRDHVHNRLAKAIAQGYVKEDDVEAQWEVIKNVLPTGSKEKWQQLFNTTLQDGHFIAIASFSEYKPLIEKYLRHAIGLSDEVMEKIFIESWLPKNPLYANKNQHIKNIIDYFHFTKEPQHIILVDDSVDNQLAALSMRYHVVKVLSGNPSGHHIDEALTIIAQLTEEARD